MSPKDAEFMDLQSNAIQKLALVPCPLQQLHPPLWQVVDSPLSIQFAAENRMNCMMWIPPVDALKPRFELYREKRSEAEGRTVKLGEGVALVRDMFVAETMEEAEQFAT